MPCQGQGQVRSPKVITNYLFNWVWAAHDLWVILFIECNSETRKVIRVNDRSRSGRTMSRSDQSQNYKIQQYWAMSPGTGELIDRIQPERVNRLWRQSTTLDMPYQGQGQIRSPKVITNYLFNVVCAAHNLCAILFIEWYSEAQKVIQGNARSRSDRYQVQVRSK